MTPGLGRSLEQKAAMHSSVLCLGNPMDRAWRVIVQGFAESDMTEHTHACILTREYLKLNEVTRVGS